MTITEQPQGYHITADEGKILRIKSNSITTPEGYFISTDEVEEIDQLKEDMLIE